MTDNLRYVRYANAVFLSHRVIQHERKGRQGKANKGTEWEAKGQDGHRQAQTPALLGLRVGGRKYTVEYGKIQCNTIQSNPIQSNPGLEVDIYIYL